MDAHALPPQLIALDKVGPTEDSLGERLGSGSKRKYARFLIAAPSSIPWIGGVIAASASLSAEMEQGQVNELHRLWLASGAEAPISRELNAALKRRSSTILPKTSSHQNR